MNEIDRGMYISWYVYMRFNIVLLKKLTCFINEFCYVTS